MDCRRSSVAGRARHRGAGDLDRPTTAVLRRRSRRRSNAIWRVCRAPASPGRAGRRTAPSMIVADWSEAPGLDRPDRSRAPRIGDRRAEAVAAQVTHAGAIFLGRWTPEAIGDYIAGPNHVLPTARSARFASGLGVLDFLKRTSLVRCDRRSLAALAPAAIRLAEAEGLDAHALSLSIRLDRRNAPEPHDDGRAKRKRCGRPAHRHDHSRRAYGRPPQCRYRA